MLKEIPKDSIFTIRLVEPMKSGFHNIGPKSSGAKSGKKPSYGSGKETLRFKANGQAAIESEVFIHFAKYSNLTLFYILDFNFAARRRSENRYQQNKRIVGVIYGDQ